jgi:hypothetical protein
MKIIKNISLVVIGTCAINFAQAQEVKADVAKQIIPAASVNLPETKPNPDLSGNNKKQEQPVLKQSTEKPVVPDEKMEDAKPKLASPDRLLKTAEIQAEPRQNAAGHIPLIPAPVRNIAPVTVPVYKPKPGTGQQKL